MSVIQLRDENVVQTLNRAASGLVNPEPLAAALERVLVSQSLQNFHANGRPAWAGLSPVTLAIYRRQGIVPQGILQRSAGGLRDSVQGDHDSTSATVGAGSGKSTDYAAIHQFGGMAGRGKKVRIPARPYLPMDDAGFLQPEAETAVEYTAQHFLSHLFD
ncbi:MULTISPECIES: phage virion morphogenesis protein [unclassified Acinetobacter]|uniref:phage virion morphogenesis protein n=1 Tax=unclassified Acinetobacter TaxID=196816 RepID=UPI0019099604|nr:MULTISPECIES: phage virion morphogenesis protein [unclassified Acinetobacter]MBK0063959.1 phage virion morphogenesis protein [Acinetobacter sp. S55]MBK0067244.1 phage virion morphogenesis protein [Acinetobacter sp. S54]